jgi:hypothetical protein
LKIEEQEKQIEQQDSNYDIERAISNQKTRSINENFFNKMNYNRIKLKKFNQNMKKNNKTMKNFNTN